MNPDRTDTHGRQPEDPAGHIEHPVPVEGRSLSYFDAVTATVAALYNPRPVDGADRRAGPAAVRHRDDPAADGRPLRRARGRRPPPSSRPHTPQAAGLPPTVVISVTGDPATPYEAGVGLAAAIGGRLVSVAGTQHTAALQGNPCVDRLVTDYLVDLQIPAGPTSCSG